MEGLRSDGDHDRKADRRAQREPSSDTEWDLKDPFLRESERAGPFGFRRHTDHVVDSCLPDPVGQPRHGSVQSGEGFKGGE